MINKSYISRQSLIDACNAYSESPWANDYGGYSKGVRDALRAIKDCALVEAEDATIGIGLPYADVVEVVRCGQCRFTKTDGTDDPAIYCEKWDRWEMPPDFYCSYGERKDGDA
jgi:hypothetical protein